MPLFKKRPPEQYTISWLDCRNNRHEIKNVSPHHKIVFELGLQSGERFGIVKPQTVTIYRQWD